MNNYIRFSDTTAGFAVAVESAVLGALFRLRAHEAFVNIPMRSWGATAWLTVVCFFSLGAAIAAGVCSVWPRLRNPQPKGYLFWEAILAHSDAETLGKHFRKESTKSLAQHLAHHVFILSGICQRKFHWVGWCIRLGIVGAVLSGLLLLIL